MNRYTRTCILVGAAVAGAIGFIGVNLGGIQLSGLWGALAFLPFGAIGGYAASACRASIHPIHPYAKPPEPANPDARSVNDSDSD